ncbi:unnamed protein product [Haemonchus placei]|uniref:SH3 domain-containing protein n=1 Tax=Haemonchus placei TaxID=6290 RepID=A0A0N4W840_HAEPC|nr:unnamed protein product [Haemonchus placei]
MGVWIRLVPLTLQYVGEYSSEGYLCSRYLRLVKNIATPQHTHARLVKRSARTGKLADHAIILTLRAFIEFSHTNEASFFADDIGYIMVDEEEMSQKLLISRFEKGALVEVEFVNDSWWLRRLLGEWRDDIDLSNFCSQPVDNELEMTENRPCADELHQAAQCPPVEGRNVRSRFDRRSGSNPHTESDSTRERMDKLSLSFNDLSMATVNQQATSGSPSPLGLGCSDVPKWIPPKLPPNNETIIDVTSEQPAGRNALPAWCCIVKIREDHVIGFAPIPGVHKVLIASELLRNSLCITGGMRFLKLGQWINVMCEPRRQREYDDVRPPHFSHIATEICTVPQRHPPVEPWDQRIVCNLLQIFLRCDLSIPGNVKRVQVGNDNYFLLNCMHNIPMMAPAKRLEGLIDAKLIGKAEIGYVHHIF